MSRTESHSGRLSRIKQVVLFIFSVTTISATAGKSNLKSNRQLQASAFDGACVKFVIKPLRTTPYSHIQMRRAYDTFAL
ncbi:hypothetical protein DIRU0_E17568 [Diutina rugosa]